MLTIYVFILCLTTVPELTPTTINFSLITSFAIFKFIRKYFFGHQLLLPYDNDQRIITSLSLFVTVVLFMTSVTLLNLYGADQVVEQLFMLARTTSFNTKELCLYILGLCILIFVLAIPNYKSLKRAIILINSYESLKRELIQTLVK